MKVIKRENDYHNTLRIINPDKPTIVVCKHEPYISSFFYKIQQENSDAVISELVIKVDNISISNISRNNKDFQDACGRAMYSPQCELLQFDNTEEYNDWLKGIQKAEKERQLDAWVTIQRSHAIANGLPVISVNRVGFEPSPSGKKGQGIQFWGNSFLAGPQGEIIANSANDKEETLVADIDIKRSEKVRRNWPFLRDRRIDCFSDLTKRYGK